MAIINLLSTYQELSTELVSILHTQPVLIVDTMGLCKLPYTTQLVYYGQIPE